MLPAQFARLGQATAIVVVSFIFSVSANAQVPTSGNVFFGYSYYNTSSLFGSTNRNSLNGWEGSLEGKVVPWVGIVADFSRHYGSQQGVNPAATCAIGVVCSPLQENTTVQTFLFGPRVSVSIGKLRPFAEALFGGAHISSNNGGGSDTSFATALGGGLDYRIIRPVAWRFQGDYVQTRLFGTTQNNVRLSTGIVLRF
jgi:Outer membrane protein beta-barrel domain